MAIVFAKYIAREVIEWVATAFLCEDHNICFIAVTVIEYIWFTFCAFLSFRYERRKTVNSQLRLGNDSEDNYYGWGTTVVLAEASLRYVCK